jgi:hypothetical protein
MKLENLRLLIREKLRDGRLPHEPISRVQCGPADGQKCDACETLIRMAQIVVTGITLAGKGFIQLHVECFQIWDDERCAHGPLAAAPGPAGSPLRSREAQVSQTRSPAFASPRSPVMPAGAGEASWAGLTDVQRNNRSRPRRDHRGTPRLRLLCEQY